MYVQRAEGGLGLLTLGIHSVFTVYGGKSSDRRLRTPHKAFQVRTFLKLRAYAKVTGYMSS